MHKLKKIYALQSIDSDNEWVTHDYVDDLEEAEIWVRAWSDEYNEAARHIRIE